MRPALALAAISALLLPASCTSGTEDKSEPSSSSRYTFWRPAPVLDAPEPNQVVQAAPASDWRSIRPEYLLVLDLKDGQRVLIELTTDFAPVHVANVRAFARAGWWTNSTIYRVQDNYVAQWGIGEEEKRAMPAGVVKLPPHEYHRPLTGLNIRPLGFPDAYAPLVGHADSWPVGYDPEQGRAWLIHCYSYVGVARDLAPDTGSGSELYAIIGHAPRHLDLNIAVIGRVISGMEALSARPRGTDVLGMYKEKSQHIPIARARLAADIPASERPAYEVLRSDSDSFSQYITGRANRGGEFFQRPTGGVDICNAQVPIRRKP